MARLRNRMTKAEFWTDPDLLSWPREKRWFYQGLRALAEDSGCCEDSPFGWMLVLYASPMDRDITEEMVITWRDELIASGKLVPYTVAGKRYLYQTTFHQHEHPRNPQSPDLPLPPWVSYKTNANDGRKVRYEVDEAALAAHIGGPTTVVQPLYNDVTTLPAQSCPAQSCPVQPIGISVRKSPAISAPPVDKSSEKADELLSNAWFPDKLIQLAELLAEENKTGKARLSRIIRVLYSPLVALQQTLGREALEYGLDAAITAGAPNANYVKRAAANYKPPGTRTLTEAYERPAWMQEIVDEEMSRP